MRARQDFAFLHGGGQGGWVWDATIDALDRQTGGAFGRALALDVPGCGSKRDRPTDGLAIADVARELVADVEAAGLRDVVLVGHSQAGQAMPIMARMRPALFRRLVYVTCSAPPPGRTIIDMMRTGPGGDDLPGESRWTAPATSAHDRLRPMFCNDMDPRQATAFLSRLGRDMWPAETYREHGWRYDELGAIPATFVLCLRDAALPLAWQEAFADRFGVERRVRLDAGHQPMVSRPNALAEILRIEAGLPIA